MFLPLHACSKSSETVSIVNKQVQGSHACKYHESAMWHHSVGLYYTQFVIIFMY